MSVELVIFQPWLVKMSKEKNILKTYADVKTYTTCFFFRLYISVPIVGVGVRIGVVLW